MDTPSADRIKTTRRDMLWAALFLTAACAIALLFAPVMNSATLICVR